MPDRKNQPELTKVFRPEHFADAPTEQPNTWLVLKGTEIVAEWPTEAEAAEYIEESTNG